jgi:RHS repeat-associated protein
MEDRFISKDPIGFKGGINLYGYTDNNPISIRTE